MTVVLIATGGTIACTQDKDGFLVPTKTAADLAACLNTEVRTIDCQQLDSSAITLEELDTLIELVEKLCEDPDVERIIITHGTDSLEETAMALTLFHKSIIPVVLTGAQLPMDHPESDGPVNLRASLNARGVGVMIQFGGRTTHAWGARKEHTFAIRSFDAPDVDFPATIPLQRAPLRGLKVPIVAAYPGAPRHLVDAAVQLGCDGIVVECMGSGNTSPEMGAALIDAMEQGIAVVLSTRVPHGEIQLIYGCPGGGATLGAHGALSAGVLRPGQARIALAAALATGTPLPELFY